MLDEGKWRANGERRMDLSDCRVDLAPLLEACTVLTSNAYKLERNLANERECKRAVKCPLAMTCAHEIKRAR